VTEIKQQSRPKVLMLTADYPPEHWSGIGVVVQLQSEDLATLGVQVEVMVAGRDGFAVGDSLNPLIKVLAGDTVPTELGGKDWLHLHSLPLTELALEWQRRSGAKLACTVHTQPLLELADLRLRRFWLDVQARLLSACDRVIFLSMAEWRSAQALFPSLPATHVIPNGVPKPPEKLPGPELRRTVTYAGRFALGKGILLLEQCIRRMLLQSDTAFLIAGGHGDPEGVAAVERIARNLSFGSEVVGWLPRNELDERLGQSRLVLVPSRYEPGGLIALEAMRMGTPVLAAAVGGLGDIGGESSGVVLLDSEDPQDWADEALRILRDKSLWARLHRQGPDYVKRCFSSSRLAERLLSEVYEG
jgi:1,4-alpha-glucan branching enzyme